MCVCVCVCGSRIRKAFRLLQFATRWCNSTRMDLEQLLHLVNANGGRNNPDVFSLNTTKLCESGGACQAICVCVVCTCYN